jgi:acyl-CoA thioesterase
MKSPKEIVDIMLNTDLFSEWMNVSVEELGKGFCTLSCTTKKEMLNGFDILHGGITYSLSDSALAFASNSYGNKCVSVETSISHIRPVGVNTKLRAKCVEIHRGKTIGIYTVDIFDNEDKLVSKFKGTVHISRDLW